MRTAVCFLLTALLVPTPGWPQAPSGPASNLVQGSGVKIAVLQGEGAQNSIRDKRATQPAVKVTDDADKPIAGAEVVFQLPAAGPGGVFNGWMRTQTTRTDANGEATAQGMTPNDQEGRFNIKVTATSGSKSASVIIAQVNTTAGTGSAAAKSSSKKKGLLILLGLAAVGGIAGGIAATRGGNGSTTPATTPVSITPGPVTVGAPR